jgi:putative ABC transport system permease protein
MFQNYLKTTLRNLFQNRFYTSLNVLGLSVGIGTGLLILLWVQGQYSQYAYPDAERIFRVNAHLTSGDGVNSWPYTSGAIVPHGLREVPELESGVRVWNRGALIEFKFDGKLLFEKNAAYVDSNFFDFFKIELLQGDPKRPFTAVNSMVVTEDMARKFFGSENPIGKIIQRGPDPKDMFTVSGVMRDWPASAGFDYSYLMSFERVTVNFKDSSNPNAKFEDSWGSYSMFSFVKTSPNASVAAAEKKVDDMNVRHNPNPTNDARLSLQPIRQIALFDAAGNDTGAQTAQIFLFAALFILGIACINYINLGTAQATKRAREVGMRKIIGAGKWQLIGQFLFESALVTGAAFVIGLLMLRLALPFCNRFLEQKMMLDWQNPAIAGLLGGAFVSMFLLSGLYPAFVLARFQPMRVLKGKVSANLSGEQWLRRGLVVLQFGLGIILLVGTTLIGRQLDFLRQRDAGFSRDHVFSFGLRNNMAPHKEAMIAELEKTPGVETVAQSGDAMLGSANTTSGTWDGKPAGTNINFYYFNAGKNLKDALKFQLAAGEWFTGTAADTNKYVVNETAVRTMGLQDPIGKRFALGDVANGVIVGVVRDFNFNSAREKIRPVAFYSNPDECGLLSVRVRQEAVPNVLAKTGELWKQYEAVMPFDYQFMDDEFDQLYRADQRTGVLFRIFSAIALFIACIGLFGLAMFMAEQRRKEIGVRKVLGASVAGITGLLAKDFLKLVLVAIMVASPVAYYLMQKWLADFAYRIEIQWWMFAAAGAAAVLIAFLTVCFQSVRAALADPVKSLRSE